MRVVTRPVAKWLNGALKRRGQVTVTVAYFHPNRDTLKRLRRREGTRVIVSGEFHINDPRPLRELANSADVRVVSPDSDGGRLHAKVILVKSASGHRSALVGSANFTYGGLFKHNEVCVALDSRHAADQAALDDLEKWIEGLSAEVPDWDLAFQIHQQMTRRGRANTASVHPSANCWALKTTEGPSGPSHWQDFLAEGVVAIGWRNLRINPRDATKQEFQRELGVQAGAQVWSFVHEWQPGDLVLICRGYNTQQTSDVYLYGYARVEGDFEEDGASGWEWHFKRRALIIPVEQRIPKVSFTQALKKETLLRTVHRLDRRGFHNFIDILAREFGVPPPTDFL